MQWIEKSEKKNKACDHDLYVKNKNVGNNTRFPPASFLLNGQIIDHTTVKWPIKTLNEYVKF